MARRATRPEALAKRIGRGPPLLLDGALGTELERRGAPVSLPLWSSHALIRQPELVARIHSDYVEAGAELLTANTFRTQRRVLERAGVEISARELTRRAVALAREAALGGSSRVFVLGSAPTLEDCYHPERVPDEPQLSDEHAEHVDNLVAAGVDAVLVETINTRREALAAARAARAAGVEFLVSFICRDDAMLLSGEPLSDALAAVAGEGPAALLVNCLPTESAAACLPALATCGRPFGIYANLGQPQPAGPGWEDPDPDAFARAAQQWLDAGARLVGGCCGTGPEHIRAIAQRIRSQRIRSQRIRSR